MNWRRIAVALSVVLLAGGRVEAEKKPTPPSRHRLAGRLQPCRLEGIDEDVLCGRYEVYEDRAGKSGRKIALHVVVLPARAAKPADDALVFLAGGGVVPATRYAAFLARALGELRAQRDVLLVDQRGCGESNPLDCDLPENLSEPSLGSDDAAWRAAVRRCRDTLAERADLRFYTTPLAMDDLYEVCQWLGYPRIDLWGASYGTKAARVYLRQHPEHVRTLVLHGVVPLAPSMSLDLAASAQRSLDRVLVACGRDSTCRHCFTDLHAELDSLFARCARGPVPVQVPDPQVGNVQLQIDETMLRDAIYDALSSSRTIVQLPFTVHAAYGGDWAPLQRWVHPHGAGAPRGVFYCILCSEDIALVDAKKVASAAARTFVGEGPLRRQIATCEEWPRGWLPDAYFEPVAASVPALLLTGEFDHVTPTEYAERAAWHLAGSRQLVLPGRGHADIDPCVVRLVQSFVESGGNGRLDTSCLEKPLRFVTRAADLEAAAGP